MKVQSSSDDTTNVLNQGWGTYSLPRVAWIVHSRWRAGNIK